jgi:4-hydroxybenzoate polyprenyltransferase
MLTAYLKLFRFPLVFTAVADSAAGYLLALREERPNPVTLALLAAASGTLYCFGMAMNDIADRERDKAMSPNRPLPSGKIRTGPAVLVSILLLAASGAAVAAIPHAPPVRFGVWGAIVFLILSYDFFLKKPPVMGLIRAFDVFLGTAAASAATNFARPEQWLLVSCLSASLVYVTALTYVSTQEEGEIRRGRLRAGALVMALAAFVPPTLGATAAHGAGSSVRAGSVVSYSYSPTISVAGAIAAGLLGVWILLRTFRAADRKGVMLVVRDGVAGIILLDASMVMSSGSMAWGLAVAGLLLPAAALVAVFKRLA